MHQISEIQAFRSELLKFPRNGQPKLIFFFRNFVRCERRSTDEYAVLFKEIFSLKSSVQGAIDPIDAVAISSVVPTLTDRIASAAQLFSGCSSLVLIHRTVHQNRGSK